MKRPVLPEFFSLLKKSIGRTAYGELVILFAFIVVITFVVKTPSTPIRADGIGYFDYLPSLFEEKDLIRKDYSRAENPELYERISKMGMYVDYKEFRVNKYHCGTAVLISPFYFAARLFTNANESGNYEIEKPFQIVIYIAALFYLFLSLVFLRKLLRLYHISPINIFIAQLLLVFSTSVIHYAAYEASFSHIYSLFAISAFLFTAKAYFTFNRESYFLWSCLLLGLIAILRPVNPIIIFFLPFLAGSFSGFKNGVLHIFRKPLVLITGIIIALAVVSIQLILWYLQTGEFVIYSYQNEGFNFLSPRMSDILFSYRKGLFIYTPVLLLSLLGLIRLLKHGNYYLAVTWVLFFLVVTYFLSSWNPWYYGASYGMRVYVEFYPVFFVLFALLIENLRISYKTLILVFAFACVTLNIIQAKQYKRFILNWHEMDKASYWRVFLKTSRVYEGLLWKTRFSPDNYRSIKHMDARDFNIEPGRSETILKAHFNTGDNECKTRFIQLSFENEFSTRNRAIVDLQIFNLSDSVNHYYYNPFLIRFYEVELNTFHRGLFNFPISGLDCSKEYEIIAKVYARDKPVNLKGVTIDFIASR
jgi:hypothetical protein